MGRRHRRREAAITLFSSRILHSHHVFISTITVFGYLLSTLLYRLSLHSLAVSRTRRINSL